MSETVRETLTLGELRQAAEFAERQLVSAGVVTEEMVALRRPGTPAYPDEGVTTWLLYYNWLGIKTPDSSGAPSLSGDAVRALGEAMVNEPRSVKLVSGETVAVYPKGYHALQWLGALDGCYCGIKSVLHELERLDDEGQDVVLRVLGTLVEGLAVRLWAWVLTHPESDVPFSDVGPAPEPPEWTRTITGADIFALWQAHQYLHQAQMQLISGMFPTDPASPTRLPLHGFLAAEARDRNVRTADFLRRWPLGEIFATSVSAAQLQRETMARAKANAGAD